MILETAVTSDPKWLTAISRVPRCRRCILAGLLVSALLHGAAGLFWLRQGPPPPPETRVVQLDLAMFAAADSGPGDTSQDPNESAESPAGDEPVAPQPSDPTRAIPPEDEADPDPPSAPADTAVTPTPPQPGEMASPPTVPAPAVASVPDLAQPSLPPAPTLRAAPERTRTETKPAKQKIKASTKPAPKKPAKPAAKKSAKKTPDKPIETRPRPAPKPEGTRKPTSKPKATATERTQRTEGSGSSTGRSSSKGRTGSKAVGSTAGKASAERTYLAELQRAIGRHQRFPDDARQRRKTGVATVSFEVKSDGRIRKIRLARSSGDASLDKAALDALHRLDRFKPIPAAIGRRNWSMRVPIRFDLR